MKTETPTTATHTPGPWVYRDWMLKENGRDVVDRCGKSYCPHCKQLGGETPVCINIVADGFGVALLSTYDPQREHAQHVANACLIATAPDLLDALRAFCGDYESTPLKIPELQAAYLHALTVIAKAEGR